MAIHVGKLIQKRLQEVGMSKAEFARRISKTSQNIYDIFGRKTLDTGLLLKISEVLNYDFFQHYSMEYEKENSGDYQTLEEITTALVKAEENSAEYLRRATQLEKENAYLKEINELLKNK